MTVQVVNRYTFNPGIAVFTFYADDKNLLGVDLNHSKNFTTDKVLLTKSNKIIEDAIVQVIEYTKGERKEFDLPLLEESIGFKKDVLDALNDIEYGETVSYSELGEKLDKKKSARAVGNSLARNNFPVIIPCHRVIRTNGDTGNYIGGKDLKKDLLVLEKNNK